MKGCLLMSNFSTAQLRNFLCLSIVTVATVCYVVVSFGSYNQDSPSAVYYAGVHQVQNRHNNRSKNILAHELTVMNIMGGSWTTLRLLEELMKPRRNLTLLARMRLVNGKIMKETVNRTSAVDNDGDKLTINVAAVSCGPRRHEFLVMAKSAVMFSMNAFLHFIVFSDKSSILDLAQDLLELKWTVNRLGWDFTYELHLEWFPPHDHNDPDWRDWRDMYKPCTTQRLFFPTLLPHIDALIYLDSDIIIVSDLTELWSEFGKMGDTKLAAMSANNEDTAVGWYNTMAKIPYYGNRGVNAGVMLMNLTRMREFRFQKRAMAAQVLYNEKISLADQDIVNVIFHTFPERMHLLDCSFNFNWVHCGYGNHYVCHKGTESFCFCKGITNNGVRIVHGNGGTFKNQYFSFLVQLYQGFKNFDFLKHSPGQLISQLRLNFTKLEDRCRPLDADMLYRNAESYFKATQNASSVILSS